MYRLCSFLFLTKLYINYYMAHKMSNFDDNV